MQILNSTISDIPEIFRLYRIASDHQRAKQTVVVWPEFEKELVETEVKENRQWKLLINEKIACVWTITFSDEKIREERNADAAVYIHRIATDPDFRGNKFVKIIVAWARHYAKDNGKDFIRLDTLGNNTRLIDYYTHAEFTFPGFFYLKNTEGLLSHYHGVPACLFEMKLKN